MRLWLRRLPVKTEYVPVTLSDSRPRELRWEDEEYLRAVTGFGTNGVYMCEVADALAECRLAADKAKTPDELAGVQVGIKLLRGLLTMSARARVVIQARKQQREDEDHVSLG